MIYFLFHLVYHDESSLPLIGKCRVLSQINEICSTSYSKKKKKRNTYLENYRIDIIRDSIKFTM